MNLSSGVNSSAAQQQRKTHNQNIQAYVRLRPLNARERCIRSTEVVDVISPREIVARHTVDSKLTKKFTFDRTFGPDSRQVEVYSTVVAPLIEEVLAGYNCTVFAYGQTGTGKTHTMIGTECAELKSSWEDDSDIGIIPRALSHLFDELRMMEMEFSMRISYLELYNEELCDLLSTDDSTKIRIFDDSTKKGSVIIQGLEEITVHSKDDVYKLLEKGKERRKTASTLMNAQSSRSHTVFSILVHIRENGIDGEEMLKIGKLNLVDLAGSENVSKAGNEKGIRVRETVNINQSLLTLGRVITALVERTPHVPYRESKLTRLLQESLGGRTKTSIIATISPGHKDIEETLSTLEYAHRAKNIQNKPEVNQKLTKKIVLKEYTEEIDKLKRDLIAARDRNGIYLAEETYMEMTLKMDSQNRELNEKMLLLKALKDELQNKERIFNEVSLNLVEKTEELKRKNQHLVRTKGELCQTKRVLTTTKRRYKEKKVLLESHVKTEQTLTSQATQILEAADIASNDTEQLLSTIERRKDVDRQIQSVCSQFSERMHDNFEMMDESLERFQDQHKSFSKMIIDDFASSATIQGKLLSAASTKIKHATDLCSTSFSDIDAICEKYVKQLVDHSEEHRSLHEKMLLDLMRNDLQCKIQQIQKHLHEVQDYNDKQKLSFNEVRESVVQALQLNTIDVKTHAAQMQKQLDATVQISVDNLEKLSYLCQAIDNDHEIAVQEQHCIDDFIIKMQAIKQQRADSCHSMRDVTSELNYNTNVIVSQLKEAQTEMSAFEGKRCVANTNVSKDVDNKVERGLEFVGKNVVKCAATQMELDNLNVDTTKHIDKLCSNATQWHNTIHTQCDEYGASVKRLRLQSSNDITSACMEIERGLNEDCQRLKGNITVGIEFANTLESQVREYAKRHLEHVGQCSHDVNEFKQNELQTYTPTGTTPSKRDFMYPRVLASTSPHMQIVRRVRQENEWSDLDTTATIDEGSEMEADDEERSVVHSLSEADTILNSTPVDSSIRNTSNRSRNNNSNSGMVGKNVNTLQVHSRNGSLSKSLTPQKPNASPSFLKQNKENFA